MSANGNLTWANFAAMLIDAIDRALYWTLFILFIALWGVLSVWFWDGFLAGLPIVWDGSLHMWGKLWLGLHAVLFGGIAIVSLVGLFAANHAFDEWRKQAASKKALDRLWWVSFFALGIGVSGLLDYLPLVGRDVQPVPLWVAIPMTLLGGFGMYRQRAKNDGIAEPEKRTRELQPIALAVGAVLLLFLVLTSINNDQASRPAEYSATEAAAAANAASARSESPAPAGPCALGRAIEPIITSPEVPQPHMAASLSSEWLGGGLYGNDNDVARLGPVTITGDATSGYRVKIRSQSEFRCGLTADADGNPSRLTTCIETTGYWTILTPSIRLNCFTRPTEMVCTGPFSQIPTEERDDPCHRQTWNVTIARPR